ncbi:MAG: MopE-related protein, partial [Myxococcota bacterium]
IQLYNRYWGNDPVYDNDNPLDPTAFGCSADPVVVDRAAECACGTGALVDSTCDGIDDDCDGSVDEDWVGATCGVGACGSTATCVNGIELPCIPAEPSVSLDLTCDNIDDDCDGDSDEDWIPESCGVFGCTNYSECNSGVVTACVPLPPNPETCNGLDDNCNGVIDEGLDIDQDGFGPVGNEGCAGGTRRDCNDNNIFINPDALEVCDLVDNDCDTQVDENVLNRCDNCRSSCTFDVYGSCDDCIDFDPTPDNSGQVGTNPDGNLELERQEIDQANAWIANNEPSTVSKFDTRTGFEVARYQSVLGSFSTSTNNPNPSRTAVDSDGNVYVGNRNENWGLTKIGNWTELCDRSPISPECQCRDRNNNGTIETSRDADGDGRIDQSDPDEYLGAADECLLWNSRTNRNNGDVGGYIRGVAIDSSGFVWASEWNDESMHRFDPETGNQVAWVQTPMKIYGLVSFENDVWAIEHCCGTGGRLARIDTTAVVNNGTNTNPNSAALNGPYSQSWSGSTIASYGVAVDSDGRLWVAAYGRRDPILIRYDPSTNIWTSIPNPGCLAWSGAGRGVAVSTTAGSDIVWIAQHGGAIEGDCSDTGSGEPRGRITGFNADTFAVVNNRDIASDCHVPIGIAVGAGGSIWTACRNTPTGGGNYSGVG